MDDCPETMERSERVYNPARAARKSFAALPLLVYGSQHCHPTQRIWILQAYDLYHHVHARRYPSLGILS